jgi:hypothetical protein
LNAKLLARWRISTFRLAILLGLLFTVGNVALLGLVYWQTSLYMAHRVDDSIYAMSRRFPDGDAGQVTAQVTRALVYDLRKSNLYGLFAADGRVIAGNMRSLPQEKVDGEIHQFAYRTLPPYEAAGGGPEAVGLVRALARRLTNGEILIVGRDFTQMAEIKSIIL